MSEIVLVTGGAGFIGSHACVELLDASYRVVVIDNLSNSSAKAIERVREIADVGDEQLCFIEGDLLDRALLERLFAEHRPASVVHFAGLKAVGESTEIPLSYYSNNVSGTVVLLETMQRHDVRRLVFSSSCTVYGDVDECPITEEVPTGAANPYGRTKLIIEHILSDLAASEPDWHIVPLRYFNPVGAHPSGRIGEDPNGIPNNLMPFIMQVAVGRRERLQVFGGDYPTADGTGVRDYIHVVDLAQGHLAALRFLDRVDGCEPYNLGTGRGYSVLEVIEAAEHASGRKVPYDIVDRRAGDIAASWADPERSARDLGWRGERTLEQMCVDAWRWQSQNPNGYRES